MILRHGRPPTRIIRMLQSGIHGMQRGYVGVVARMAPKLPLTLALLAMFAVVTGWFARTLPSGFQPEEDQGAFMVEAQLPEGASINSGPPQ